MASLASLFRFAVLFAILSLPSRVSSQDRETMKQETGPQPATAAAVLPNQPESHTGDLDGGRSSSAGLFGTSDDAGSVGRESIFVFGGFFSTGSMNDASHVFQAPYDGNSIIGLGYQRYPWSMGDIHLGWEIGVAGRFGTGHTGELWSGPTIRYDGIVIPGLLKVTPSFTAGLSAVSDTMGIERVRERIHKGDGSLLFYLGPELALSTTDHPNLELFYRLHHRSGAWGTLGKFGEGYNASVIGVRYRY